MLNRSARPLGETVRTHHAIRVNHTEIHCKALQWLGVALLLDARLIYALPFVGIGKGAGRRRRDCYADPIMVRRKKCSAGLGYAT
jgi:hypothetical protein